MEEIETCHECIVNVTLQNVKSELDNYNLILYLALYNIKLNGDKLMQSNWTKEINATITVCDENGIIIDLNDKAIQKFEEEGGEKLIGTKLLDCHPEPHKTKLKELISSKNVSRYTTEKNGKKNFIYHTPWFEEGKYKGYVEMIIGIPFDMPHYKRD